jgi:hypothetical protein
MSAGYGRTIYCYGPNGLQPGRSLSGRAALAASIWRRLTTPRGTLQGGDEELAFGYDIRRVLGAPGDLASVARLASIVESEVAKEERVAAVAASVLTTRDSNGSIAVTLRVDIVPANDDEQFALTLDVTALDVQVLGGLPT